MTQFQTYIFLVAVMLIALTSCTPKPTISVPAEFESGQNHFHRVCANCHGADALGKQTRAPGLIDPEYLFENFSDEEMYKQIVEAAEFESGQNHFHRVCANCHGADALGKQTRAPGLIDPEYLFENFSDEEMYKQIVEGSDKMPPQRNKLSDPEVAEIINYIRYSQSSANLIAGEDESDDDEDE